MLQRRTSQTNVRAAAAWVLERTLSSHSPVDTFLDGELSRCDQRDHGLLLELVLGSLRWLRRLDRVIADAANRPVEDIEPALHAPLRIAAYQLLFLDRVPAHAVVNEAVEQAHCLTHRGGVSFVNAVLRRVARNPTVEEWPVDEPDPVRRLAIEMSHPDFLVQRWQERFGRSRTLELLKANNRPKPIQLLAFRDRGGRELLAESLIDEGLDVEPSSLSPLGLKVRSGNPLVTEAFRRGDFYVQDEASQAAALIPPPRPGETIFDAAAAPGGKSFSLVSSEPSIQCTLADVSTPRVGTLWSNCQRLHRPLRTLVADAGQPPVVEEFDRVVLDLPCSGTGTLRKHPELKWRVGPEEIGRLSVQGLRMLEGGAPLVRPGGILSAITCSLEVEENEKVVGQFLEHHDDFSLLPLEDLLPSPLGPGIVGPGSWRLLPGDDHDGFTVHVLARSG